MIVAGITGLIARAEVADWYAKAIAELGAALAGRAVTGPFGGVYDNELFTQSHGHAIIYRPTGEPSARGRVRPVTLPATELAVTVHLLPPVSAEHLQDTRPWPVGRARHGRWAKPIGRRLGDLDLGSMRFPASAT